MAISVPFRRAHARLGSFQHRRGHPQLIAAPLACGDEEPGRHQFGAPRPNRENGEI